MTLAITEYSPTEAALADLSNRFKGVVFNVSTTKGMEEARKARAEIRGYRTNLESKRKEIKAPALERCRLIDEEAKRITKALEELEDPIDAIIKAEEARKAAEKEARERAERERIAAIQNRIAEIGAAPMRAIGKTSDQIAEQIRTLSLVAIDETFAEFSDQAIATMGDALAKMQQALKAQKAQEVEADRLKAQREAFEAQQEQARRQQEENEAKLRAMREEIYRHSLDQEERERQQREASEAEERRRLEEAAAAEQALIKEGSKTTGLISQICDLLALMTYEQLEDVLCHVKTIQAQQLSTGD